MVIERKNMDVVGQDEAPVSQLSSLKSLCMTCRRYEDTVLFPKLMME